MALFKCKMCGGDLEIAEGLTIAECEYCGTKQTVPKAIDENMQNLFNRANTLRIKSEFDKAEKLYEKIIQADSTQAEAYWGLILCKYGIEYVDDPATFKKIPTCHRTSYDSIIADDDYKSAIENADMSQRIIYEEQAKEIDRIQKDILALAQKEESYDVFICYKETDANGQRTQDSVIANDIYYQLTGEGFKVFYAAITLEGKLGSAYEPIIFAALNSAKVMLSIGTKPEYFNAVWVKNEWSRFLKIIQKDRSKLLIPCYRDMDAYELPEEFAHLQAQDMSKIGFINDIVRGIKKVVKKDEPKPTVVKETVVTSTNANTAPLLKRAFMFLEDGDWQSADEYCEKVLDIDPENAQAYLGKLMAELNIKMQDDLRNRDELLSDNKNYQKAMRFADNEFKNVLLSITHSIEQRQKTIRQEKSKVLEKTRNSIKIVSNFISAGFAHTIGLKSNGTVIAVGNNNYGQCNVDDWCNIVTISAGAAYTVGLKSDGTVVAVGENKNGQCNVNAWYDIVTISAGKNHTIGLKSNGTVVAVGDNKNNQCNISDWRDIVAISAGTTHTVGLKSDGTVVAVGDNKNNQCNISDWRDIVAISAGAAYTVGLKSDGTVVAVGSNTDEKSNINDWRDIVAISAGIRHTVGLKADGKVVAVGRSTEEQCKIDNWRDIVAVFAGAIHTVGLKADGTVIAVGQNSDKQCDIKVWKLFNNLHRIEIEQRLEIKKQCSIEEEKKKCKALIVELQVAYQNEKNNANKKNKAQKEISALTSKHENLTKLKNEWNKIEEEKSLLDEKIKSLQSEILNLNDERARLGFFSGKRKKEIAEKIISLENDKALFSRKTDALAKKKQGYNSVSEVCNELENIEQKLNKQKNTLDELLHGRSSIEIRAELEQYSYGKDFLYPYRKAKVGDYIKFGTYEQDNNTSNGKEDIEWLVLEVKDEKALVISKYALDCQQYNTSNKNVTWETCTLRKWLNKEFLNNAFTEIEKEAIPTVKVTADKNPAYITNAGNATQDKIFLLSITESNKYFKSDSKLLCKATKYAVSGGAYVNSSNGGCWWWLRSPGEEQCCADSIYTENSDIGIYGDGVTDDRVSVRPAMWLDLG